MMGFSYMMIAIFLHTVCHCYASSEPACSKFDYEEKLLAKTIRLENTVDDVVENVAKVQTELSECQADRKEMALELETLKTEVEKQNVTVLQLQMKIGALKHEGEKHNATMAVLEERIDQMTMKMKDYESVLRPTDCPSNYTYHAELNLCWRLEKVKTLDWLTAGWQCITEGGHLLIPDSLAKIKYLQYVLVTAASGLNAAYVGGTNEIDEGKYKWINGKSAQTISWKSGQPDGGTGENCLVIELNAGSTYEFHDVPCNSKYNFLCQISL